MKSRYFLIILLLCLALALQAEKSGNQSRIDYVWWGTVSTDWNEPTNWSTMAVPNSASDVIINAGCTYYPYINTSSASCNTLTVQNGAYLTVGGYNLHVYDAADIYGQLNMNAGGYMLVDSNVFWRSGSAAAVTSANAKIYCRGNMYFYNGSNVQFEQGTVEIGSVYGFRYLYIYDADVEFCNLKSYGEGFAISSSYDFSINGNLTNISASWITSSSVHNIYLKGDLTDNNTTFQRGIKFNNSTLLLNGNTQHISFARLEIGTSYLNNLTIQAGSTVFLESGLHLKGDLQIDSGIFSVSDNTIWAYGSWINNVGPDAFEEGTSTVIFKGVNNRNCINSENFNNLELDIPADSLFIINNSTAIVKCNSYNWTSGTVTVLAGTFQANSLADNGISGGWHLSNYNGYIKLYNYGGRIDLNGDIDIYAGNFFVYGGTEPSHWPFSHDASYTNTYGTLKFFDQGIVIQDHPSYALNIGTSNGYIITTGDFTCSRTGVDLHGIVELTGNNNADISVASGSKLSYLKINKTSASNVVTALTNLDISTFALYGGTFVAPDTMYVGSGWYNTSGPDYFMEGTGSVVFDGAGSNQKIHNSEHFHTLILNRYNITQYYLSIESASVDVVCENFIWQNGRLMVDEGSFTVNNLPQNSIQGAWQLHGGTINLHQPSGRNDLDGSIKIYGGEFNIYGNSGNPISYWCYNNDAEVSLSSGTLNYANQGIYIYDNPSYTLTTAINSGTLKITGNLVCDKADFNPGTAVFEMKGVAGTQIDMIAGSGLSNLLINKTLTASGVTAVNDLVIDGDFTIQSGKFYAPANLSVSGNWDNQLGSASFEEGTGTVVLYGTTSTTCNEQGFHNLEINKPDITLTLPNNLTLSGNLTIDAGRLDCNGFDLTCAGDITVNGTLELDAGVTLAMLSGMHLTVNDGGRLEAIGTETEQVTLTNSTGYTYYTIESGGTVAAKYAIIERATNNGLYIKPGALVDTQYALEKCTFRNGLPDRTLLRIDNDQDFAVRQAIFPTNTWGGVGNVMKGVDSGLVCFVNCTGDFAGEDYDGDAYDRLLWLNNPGPGPDLVIVKAEWSNPNPYVGETDTLTVSWINVASLYNMGNFTIGLYYNRPTAPYPQNAPDQSVTVGLPSGFPAGVIMQSVIPVTHTGSAGTWNSWLWIDRTFNISETDEDNNIFGPVHVTWEELNLPAITDLSIEALTGTGEVQLDWTYPAACDRYNIYRSTEAYFVPDVSNLLDSVTYPAMQYIDTAGDKYFYIVTAEQD